VKDLVLGFDVHPRSFCKSWILPVFLTILVMSGHPAAAQSDKTWESLRENVFPNREIKDGSEILEIDAPVRAEDAAIVPITVSLKDGVAKTADFKTLTLIVDENPSPVVATFTYGPASLSPSVETRVRVNAYSYVRAIGETSDGALYMVKRFVKASGGCSAPALKDEDQANSDIGKMRFKALADSGKDRRAQLMIRHPNYSGLQMNQVTRLYIPAHFVRDIEIERDGELVWKMEGGISISENPNFIFSLKPSSGPQTIAVRAIDTDDKVFEQSFSLAEDKG